MRIQRSLPRYSGIQESAPHTMVIDGSSKLYYRRVSLLIIALNLFMLFLDDNSSTIIIALLFIIGILGFILSDDPHAIITGSWVDGWEISQLRGYSFFYILMGSTINHDISIIIRVWSRRKSSTSQLIINGDGVIKKIFVSTAKIPEFRDQLQSFGIPVELSSIIDHRKYDPQ